MRLVNNSPLKGIENISFAAIFTMSLCLILEGALLTVLYSSYTQTLNLMSTTYLSELPLLGSVFSYTQDASARDLICFLLAIFSIGVPIIIFKFIDDEKIFADFQDWISHPQNKIVAAIGLSLFAIVIAIEVSTMFNLLSPDTHGRFVTKTPSTGLTALMEKSTFTAGVISLVIVIVNCALAFATTRVLKNLRNNTGETI